MRIDTLTNSGLQVNMAFTPNVTLKGKRIIIVPKPEGQLIQGQREIYGRISRFDKEKRLITVNFSAFHCEFEILALQQITNIFNSVLSS